jgi:hypothetical protein
MEQIREQQCVMEANRDSVLSASALLPISRRFGTGQRCVAPSLRNIPMARFEWLPQDDLRPSRGCRQIAPAARPCLQSYGTAAIEG